MKVGIESGLGDVVAELEGMTERMGDLSPATAAGAEATRTAIMERFDTETDFRGQPWAEHSPGWAARRKPAKKLVQDSILRGDVHAEGAPDGILFGVSGASEDYAPVQQFGSEDGKTPARPYLPVDENGDFIDEPGTPGGELMDELEATLADYIAGVGGLGEQR